MHWARKGWHNIRRYFGSRHVFACEVDSVARQVLRANWRPRKLYKDIRTRRRVKAVDLYIAGFPCQPFSMAGSRQGFLDQNRGSIFWHVRDYIAQKRPRAFVLENVPGIKSAQGRAEGSHLEFPPGAMSGMRPP